MNTEKEVTWKDIEPNLRGIIIENAPELLAACQALIEPRIGSDKKAQLAAARQRARRVVARCQKCLADYHDKEARRELGFPPRRLQP